MAVKSAAMEHDPSFTLVALATSGDEAAFTRIVATYHPDLLRIARVVCGDSDRASEAAQSAWIVAWRRLGSLREPARLRPWLMAIAANEARQLVRSDTRRRVREIVVRDPATGPADSGVALRVDLANALGSLDPRDRALIGMRYLAGLESPEIAREFGMTAVGVRTRLARALDRLRKELGDG